MNIYLCGDATEIFHSQRSSWNARRPDNTDTETPMIAVAEIQIQMYTDRYRYVRRKARFRHQLGLPSPVCLKFVYEYVCFSLFSPLLINFIYLYVRWLTALFIMQSHTFFRNLHIDFGVLFIGFSALFTRV